MLLMLWLLLLIYFFKWDRFTHLNPEELLESNKEGELGVIYSVKNKR